MVAQYLADMECEEELLNQLVKKEDEGSLMIAYALIAMANEQNYNKEGYTYVWQDVFALLVARRPLVQDDFDIVFESMFDFEHYTKDEQGNPVLKR